MHGAAKVEAIFLFLLVISAAFYRGYFGAGEHYGARAAPT
jgi:hypothetical protein